MRLPILILATLLASPAAFAQQSGNPPILLQQPPIVQPPPPVAPPPVPSVVTPLRQPSYGVPPNISTSTPLGATPSVVYRQPADPPRKKKRGRKRFHGVAR